MLNRGEGPARKVGKNVFIEIRLDCEKISLSVGRCTVHHIMALSGIALATYISKINCKS